MRVANDTSQASLSIFIISSADLQWIHIMMMLALFTLIKPS
jgi:hypothetical protein